MVALGLVVSLGARAQGCGGGEYGCDPVSPTDDLGGFLYAAVAPACAGLSGVGLQNCIVQGVTRVVNGTLGCKKFAVANGQKSVQGTVPFTVVAEVTLFSDCSGGNAVYVGSAVGAPLAANVGMVCGPLGDQTASVNGGVGATPAFGVYKAERGPVYCDVSGISAGGSVRFTITTKDREILSY